MSRVSKMSEQMCGIKAGGNGEMYEMHLLKQFTVKGAKEVRTSKVYVDSMA